MEVLQGQGWPQPVRSNVTVEIDLRWGGELSTLFLSSSLIIQAESFTKM